MKAGEYVKVKGHDGWFVISEIMSPLSSSIWIDKPNTRLSYIVNIKSIYKMIPKNEFNKIDNDEGISQKSCDKLLNQYEKIHVDSTYWNSLQDKIDKFKSSMENINAFEKITAKMRDTYIAKNSDYGNSFDKSMDEFGITASVVRMSDKMERLKSLTKKKAQVKDESVKDTLLDLANYAIMTVMNLNNGKDDK